MIKDLGTRHWLCVGLIFATAFIVRFHHIDYGFVTWQDTGFVAGFAKAMSAAGMREVGFLALRWFDVHTGAFAYYVNHPPLSHISYAALFDLFGPREWAYRSFNLIVGGVLGGIFLFRLVHQRIGTNAAIGALILWAVVPSTAYFERMFSMSMQALTFALILTFYFLRHDDPPRGRDRFWLFVAAILGPLFDWQFSFIYVPLGIYCLFDRRRLPILISIGVVSAAVTLLYMVYAAGVAAGATTAGGFAKATLTRWQSYIGGKVEIDKSVFDLWNYLSVIAQRFDLHFSKLGIFLVGLWAAIVAFRVRRGMLSRWDWLLPAILIAPGLIYFILVPHNTLGHIWTLYFVWPVVAVMFGTVFAAALDLRLRWLGVGLAVVLVGGLAGVSLPILSGLHGLSPYHLANTRLGRMLDLQRDKFRSYAVENQDTVMFYTNVITGEISGRSSVGAWLKARQARKLPLPDVIAFNQGYRKLVYPASADRLAKRDEPAARDMAAFGYHQVFLRPAPVWARRPVDDLFLVMDQYRVPAGDAAGLADQPRIATFMSAGRVLRGIYHGYHEPRPIVTAFRDIVVPVGVDSLKLSLLLQGRAEGARYTVELAATDGTHLKHTGRVGHGTLSHLDFSVAAFRGKTATLTLHSESSGRDGTAHLYFIEPRFEGKAVDPRKNLVIKAGAAIYRDENFTNPESRIGFAHAWGFWLGMVRRIF